MEEDSYFTMIFFFFYMADFGNL